VRVALLYPPPWKIPAKGEVPDPLGGPPDDYREGDLDGDFHQIPYGLLSLAAQAMRAGHQVKVLNLSAFPWTEVEPVIAALDADVFGMSCWTANRRGVGYVAEAIRRHHPRAHVVVGGPHASPLPVDMLRHHAAIDTVTVSESELTFLELLDRVAAGRDMVGLAGAVYRRGGSRAEEAIEEGPHRANLEDLDVLVPPQEHFDTHILMTSRGCPWACTFCGAESQWGRGFRGHSIPYVLDAIEKALARLPVKMILIKDDTFTTNRKRVLELCRGIRERNLSFLWSCDTRVDLLTDELLREMRLAGCQRLSLGVESGSQSIIRNVDKKITVDEILESTRLAKKYGIRVRYFMMLGNRGETSETFRETLDFLEEARPHEYIFSCLSIYPGTHDFNDAERAGWLDRRAYFTERFQELKVPFDADEACTRLMNDWFREHSGLQRVHEPSVAELREVAARLEGHPPALVDLAGALYHAGELDEAEALLRHVLVTDYPTPGLALNYLACIAVARGDYDAMMDLYTEAARRDPQHAVLIRNVQTARAWFRERGHARGIPLRLVASHDFQLLERTQQPTLPGPLPANVADWGEASPSPGDEGGAEVARVGSAKAMDERRRLRVV
jgi:anaerobic magnesium-protoporphyrin IX monomethyl ester cyclase